MDEYKSVQKYLNKKNKQSKNTNASVRSIIISFCNRILISGILLLTVLCLIKIDPESKEVVYKNVFERNFSFATFQEFYDDHFGDLFLVERKKENELSTEMVFQENLVYNHEEKYNDGVKLSVGKNYLMPVLESGLVVFSGNKEGYGETLIIQQVTGIDAWYVGLDFTDFELYDYVEKGSLLGESKGDTIELYFQKEGEFIDYQEFIS